MNQLINITLISFIILGLLSCDLSINSVLFFKSVIKYDNNKRYLIGFDETHQKRNVTFLVKFKLFFDGILK